MRSILVVGAFAALALASPRPQEIELDRISNGPKAVVLDANRLPASVNIQPSAVAAALGAAQVTDVASANNKRQPKPLSRRYGNCSAVITGSGPAVHTPDDTPQAFLNYQPFIAASNAAAATVPSGYSLAFHGLQGSTQMPSYLGYKTLPSYDAVQCASYCDQASDCVAFNLYFERDPGNAPNATSCPNPPSITNIKCVRWGIQVSAATATNKGQSQDNFQVVIQGSNGYNKAAPPATHAGFSGPIELGGALNAPLDPTTNTNTYIGYKFFPLDPVHGVQSYATGVTSCLAACSAQTAYNARHAPAAPRKPDVCNQAVVYVLSDATQPQGVYCAMYSQEWAPEYATTYGQFRGQDYWSVSQAYAYTNASYAARYEAICALGGCAEGGFRGGNCGGWGAGAC